MDTKETIYNDMQSIIAKVRSEHSNIGDIRCFVTDMTVVMEVAFRRDDDPTYKVGDVDLDAMDPEDKEGYLMEMEMEMAKQRNFSRVFFYRIEFGGNLEIDVDAHSDAIGQLYQTCISRQ